MYDFPKIDLHLHLDGSLNKAMAFKKAKEKNFISKNTTLAEFSKLMEVDKAKNLKEYLDKFDLAIKLLQDEDDLFDFTYQLIKDLNSQNIRYAEIRFAPQFLLNNQQEKAIITVLKAKDKAIEDNLNIKINFILCMMVLGPLEFTLNKNLQTIHLVNKYLNKGICAIDLAGAEGSIEMAEFKSLFDIVNDLNLPMTIHAGEQDGIKSVSSALSFNTKRIGHGTRSIENDSLIDQLIKDNITLEICPTSNIQTKNQISYETHVIKELLKRGVKVCVNTDNMTVSNTTLEKEYDHLIRETGLTYNDLIKMMIYGIEASFAPENLKNELIKIYRSYLQ